MIAGGPMGNSRSQGMSGDARAPGRGSSPDPHLHADAASSASSASSATNGAQAGEAEHAAPPPSHAAPPPSPAAPTPSNGKTLAEALQSALSHVLEGADHMHTLLQVRADRARLSLRRWMTIGFVVVLAAITLVPLILGGVVLFVIGLAQALGHWLGENAYLGNLAAGALILGLIASATWIAFARLSRSELAKKVAKYERFKREHAARFGEGAADPRSAPAGERK